MSLQHMLLGMLKDEPQSGYDLNKVFQYVIQYFWTTEQSQIYRALHQMREKGWVKIEHIIQEDNPNKKVYHLTETGREELNRWLRDPHPSAPARMVWLAQVHFSSDMDPQDLIGLLQHRLDYVREEIAELESRWPENEPVPAPEDLLQRGYKSNILALEYGIRINRFYEEWLEDAIVILRNK